MLCEECHVNEANFTVSVVAGEETSVRHLCADCMSRMNADLVKGNVRSLLSTVLNAIRATADEAALMASAVSTRALSVPVPDVLKDAMRAKMMKSMLMTIAARNRE